MSLLLLRPRTALVMAAALVACAAASEACGSGGGSTPRKSNAGESCNRTDDCVEPLTCINLTCVGQSGSGGGTSSSTSTATSSSAASSTATASSSASSSLASSGTGLDPTQCHNCLAMKCKAAMAACDNGCQSIEACLAATCESLSLQGSPEEGQCQVHCQKLFAASKQLHLDVANCALSSKCGPCSSNPFDYNACRATADAGPCKTSKTACSGNADCTTYRNCVTGCSTLATCLACQNGQSGMAGYNLDVAYESCIAQQCILESWLP